MRITKSELIEHIKAGRVHLQWDRYVLKVDGVLHHITDSRIDRLGGMVGVEGDVRTSTGPRRLFIRWPRNPHEEPAMTTDIVVRPSRIQPLEIVDGELIDSVREHRLCGQFHPVCDIEVECCCGDTHGVEQYICCGCGHHHEMDGECLPAGPCGSYLCCVN